MELITINTATEIAANFRGEDNKEIKINLRTQQVKDPTNATHVAICSSHSHPSSSLVVAAFIQASDVETLSDVPLEPEALESTCLLTLHTWYAKQLGFDATAKQINFIVLTIDKLIASKLGTLIEVSVDGLGLAIWATKLTTMILPTEDLDDVQRMYQHFNSDKNIGSPIHYDGATATNPVSRKSIDFVDAFSQPEE